MCSSFVERTTAALINDAFATICALVWQRGAEARRAPQTPFYLEGFTSLTAKLAKGEQTSQFTRDISGFEPRVPYPGGFQQNHCFIFHFFTQGQSCFFFLCFAFIDNTLHVVASQKPYNKVLIEPRCLWPTCMSVTQWS